MTDPRGKHVKVTDQERITELESPQGITEVERSGSPQSLDDRMKELERELAQPNSELVVARSDSSSQSQPQETATATQPQGSLASLLLGLVLAAGGGYLVMQRVVITGGAYYWNRWGGGQNSFGLTLIPLLLGIGLLVYGKTREGGVLTVAGLAVILFGVLADLHMSFRPASLFEIILMFGMLAAGLALMARSLRNA